MVDAMEVIIREMDENMLSSVDQLDTTFRVESRLVISAADDRIRYSVIPVEPYEKSYSPEQLDTSIYLHNPDRVIYFAYVDGELAGQIRLLKFWNDYAFIDLIAVMPQHRGRGVGRALMEKAIQWAKEKGLPGLMAETQNINVSACRFYERCGFQLGGFDRMSYQARNPSTDEIALYWYLWF